MQKKNQHKNLIFHPFLTSPDDDQPGNKQFVVFNEFENYQLEGQTHGKLSHAIKHYEEFDKEGMNEILRKALVYLQCIHKIHLKNIKGELIASGQEAANKITLNSVHNTFDLINDKIMKGITLDSKEVELKTQYLIPLEEKYEALIASYLTDHVQVHDVTENELNFLYTSGKRINFEGIYEEERYSYFLDFSTSGLLVQTAAERSICTLFRIDKQGNCLNEIKRYFSGNVEITNPILNNYFLL
jgi:cellobiose-specific phosphotransferase system component IIA